MSAPKLSDVERGMHVSKKGSLVWEGEEVAAGERRRMKREGVMGREAEGRGGSRGDCCSRSRGPRRPALLLRPIDFVAIGSPVPIHSLLPSRSHRVLPLSLLNGVHPKGASIPATHQTPVSALQNPRPRRRESRRSKTHEEDRAVLPCAVEEEEPHGCACD